MISKTNVVNKTLKFTHWVEFMCFFNNFCSVPACDCVGVGGGKWGREEGSEEGGREWGGG